MLEPAIKDQLKNIFASLEGNYVLRVKVAETHPEKSALVELLDGFCECSEKIKTIIENGENLFFEIEKNGEFTGISFRAIPTGHEFSTLILAILNSDGKGKMPDETVVAHIKSIKGKIRLKTYISLTCTNCPDVVQTLNIITMLHADAQHEIIDGAINQVEVESLKLQGVPAVFADGQMIHSGRGDFAEILAKLENFYGREEIKVDLERSFDVVVVGGGPAGASSAIYSARKGLKVAVIAERVGGQVKETVGIENVISVPHTTGANLARDLERHMKDYAIEIFEHRKVTKIENGDTRFIECESGEKFIGKSIVIATGAKWRSLNISGEKEYIGRGVAFCPHCDGPFYKGKKVAVIGGGNSGLEAAIDLSGICSQVIVLEFLENLKADQVLVENSQKIENIKIFTAKQSLEILGNGDKVIGIKILDRKSNVEEIIELDGIFVQIGLAANSAAFKDLLETNKIGEIEIDNFCRTSQKGIYAAGDVTTVPYKQIIISMGEGAKAALSAFDDRIRGLL